MHREEHRIQTLFPRYRTYRERERGQNLNRAGRECHPAESLDDVGGFGIECGAVGRAQSNTALEIANDDVRDVDAVQFVDRVNAAGREHVQFENLVADDIHAHEVQTIGEKLGANQLADARLGGTKVTARAGRGTFGGGRFGVADGGVAAIDRGPFADADRLGPEEQQPLFALLDFGHVFLRDGVSVLGDGGDHLIEVRDLAPPDQKHLLAATWLQRFQDGGAAQRPYPLFQLLGRARHQSFGANVGGELAEVHAAAGAPQPLGIVDDQRSAQAQPPAEVDERRAPAGRAVGPGAFAARVVAQEDHVEAAQIVFLDDGLVGGERPRVVRRPRVVAVAHAPGRGQDGVVVQERQVVDGHEADVGAAAMGGERQVDLRRRSAAGRGRRRRRNRCAWRLLDGLRFRGGRKSGIGRRGDWSVSRSAGRAARPARRDPWARASRRPCTAN